MRIAVWHNTGAGGARRHLFQHVKGLLESGHEVESWCLSPAAQDFLPLGSLIREHVVPLDWRPARPTHLLAHAWSLFRDTERMLAAVDRACRRCADEMNRAGFDVLLATNCRVCGVAPIARQLGFPAVVYLHEPSRQLFEALPGWPWAAMPRAAGPRSLRAWVRNELVIRNCRLLAREEADNARVFTLRLTNSLFDRESILRVYGLDSHVCYQGVDVDLFTCQNRRREGFVIGVGSYTLHKNIPLVINAVAALPEPRPRLVWVGNGGSRNYLNDLERAAAGLGVSFEPHFGISDEELIDLYNRASVMVFAPRLEPFGLAPLEANACGLPVVAIPEGGMRETIEHGVNGLMAEPNPSSVARAITKLLSDPAYASQLGRQAREHVERRWGLRDSIARLEQQIEQVCAEHAGSAGGRSLRTVPSAGAKASSGPGK